MITTFLVTFDKDGEPAWAASLASWKNPANAPTEHLTLHEWTNLGKNDPAGPNRKSKAYLRWPGDDQARQLAIRLAERSHWGQKPGIPQREPESGRPLIVQLVTAEGRVGQ